VVHSGGHHHRVADSYDQRAAVRRQSAEMVTKGLTMARRLPIDVQLNVDESAGPFADLTYRWIDEGSAGLRPEFRAALVDQPPKTPNPTEPMGPLGEPGAPFGVITIARRAPGSSRSRLAERNCTAAGLVWLRKELQRGQPTDTDLWLGELDERGHRSGQILSLEVRHAAEDSPGWLTLVGNPLVDELLDPATGPDEQRRWLETLFGFADRTNPGFGHVSLYYDSGTTALEDAFPATMPFAARRQRNAVNECRRYLRGYSWVTIVAQELLPRLGGIERLRDTGAFTQVRPLAAGGVWLQATDDYRTFDDRALIKVFEAVAPALRPGMPRHLPNTMPGKNPQRLAIRDAAELGAQ
jgi:hypothetical protein